MKTKACVLYAQEDLRIEEREIGEMGPRQVLVRIGAGDLGQPLSVDGRHVILAPRAVEHVRVIGNPGCRVDGFGNGKADRGPVADGIGIGPLGPRVKALFAAHVFLVY